MPAEKDLSSIPVRDHVEILLVEVRRTIDKATADLDQALVTLRLEVFRAMQERDDKLRELLHAKDQHIQIALTAADKLEQERVGAIAKNLADNLLGLKNEVNLVSASAEKAVAKADAANEKRFDGVNEFRQALSNQTATFMPRAETEQRIDAARAGADALAKRLDQMEGRGQGQGLLFAQIIAGIGAVGTIAGFLYGFSAHK